MGDAIGADCEIIRYASGGLVDGDTVTGGAFKPRPADEGCLSVNRLGVFHNDKETDLARLREVVASWMTIRKTGRFAQITAAEIKKVVEAAEASFLLETDERTREGCIDDPSHALVHGIPSSEDDGAIALRDMIALSVSEVHPALTS